MINLTRDNIQTIVNSAHIQIDSFTDTAATRYYRGTNFDQISRDMYEAIQIIKVLEDDTKLSDDSVEVLLDRLIKLTKAEDTGFEGTTLSIVKNQPALNVTNILGTISGTANTIPQYNVDGNDFVPSALFMSGGSSLFHTGSVYEIGTNVSTSSARIIRAGGTDTDVDLFIAAKGLGTLSLEGGNIILGAATQITGNFNLATGAIVNRISDDLTTAFTNELATASSIKLYADALDTAARAYTDGLVATASNGLTKLGNDIQLGGGLSQDTSISMGASQEFEITSTGETEEFFIQPTVGFTLKSVGASLVGSQTELTLTGLFNYGTDQSSNYVDRSIPDVFYVNNNIGGNPVASNILNPGASEDDYSITWDNGLGFYILKTKGTAGGIADATTLNGYTAAEFLKVNEEDSKLRKLTFDLSALSSGAGREAFDIEVSADNNTAGARIGVVGSDKIEFWDVNGADEAVLEFLQADLRADQGTPPMVVQSTTAVTNLNADLVDGYNATTVNTANTVVVRDGSNNLNTTRINGILVSDFLTSGSVGGTVTATANELAVRSPSAVLHATSFLPSTSGSTNADMGITRNGSALQIFGNGSQLNLTTTGSNIYFTTNRSAFEFQKAIVVNGIVYAQSSDIIAFNSDLRKKKNIRDLERSDVIDMLNPIRYEWKHSGERSMGFGAQDVASVIPEAAVYKEDTDDYFINLSPIVAHLVRSHQMLKEEVKFLRMALNL